MGLEIKSLARGVGGHQNAQRVLGRRLVESTLDRLALVWWRGAVKDLDPVFGQIGAGDGGPQHADEVALGVVVFGEDQQPQIGPGGIRMG